jgi:hypothetical protein
MQDSYKSLRNKTNPFHQNVLDGVPMEEKPDFLNKYLHLGGWTLYHHQHLNMEGAHQLQSAVITHNQSRVIVY